MKVSIVIPVYNSETYLGRCLESVGAQDYRPLECILVDDRGDDGSFRVADEFVRAYKGPVDFRIIRHDENRGAAVARNTGIDAATGDYLLFVDSDDHIPENAVSLLATEVERHPGIDLVHGEADFDFPEDNFLGVKLHGLHLSKDVTYSDRAGDALELFSLFRLPSAPWNKLVRLELVRSNKLYFNPRLRQHQDWLWVYELLNCVRSFALVHRITYFYNNEAEGNITNTSSAEKRARMWRVIFEEVLAKGAPKHHAGKMAYRMTGIWFVEHEVVPGLFDDINGEFARWVEDCGLKAPARLLRLRCRLGSPRARKLIDGLLYRLCAPHFIQPLV